MIFKKKYFVGIAENNLYKNKLNKLTDPTYSDAFPLITSAFVKNELRAERQEDEYINAYLNGAKVLANSLNYSELNGEKLFDKKPITLPLIYLSRHCLELSLKQTIVKLGGSTNKIHQLKDLWEKINKLLPDSPSGKDRSILNNMQIFIMTMHYLDEKSTELRYPASLQGELSKKDFKWVYPLIIVDTVESFIIQLRNIDLESIEKYRESN